MPSYLLLYTYAMPLFINNSQYRFPPVGVSLKSYSAEVEVAKIPKTVTMVVNFMMPGRVDFVDRWPLIGSE